MATTYFSPGVYVEEVPSAVQPIAGVGTSTAGFIGVIPDKIIIPSSPVIKIVNESIEPQEVDSKKIFELKHDLVSTEKGTFEIRVNDKIVETTLIYDSARKKYQVQFLNEPATDAKIKGNYIVLSNQVTNEVIGTGDGKKTEFNLKKYPANLATSAEKKFRIKGTETTPKEILNDDTNSVAKVTFNTAPPAGETISGDYWILFPSFDLPKSGEVRLCTNFGEFKKFFGDFSSDPGQRKLAHAVYGFFNNGGTRCYVMRVKEETDIVDSLLEEKFEAIDEIAIVVAPGVTSKAARSAIVTHCQQKTSDRFAIFDCGENDTASTVDKTKPDNSNYAAFYFPWIQVLDPATKAMNPNGDGLIYVPPSGHIAGIYARVDTQRGVHKAPANEVVLGALGVNQLISKNQQDGLNPQGVNCIRDLNGNIRVWGARTIGGDANGEFKYLNVRRLFLFMRESIDEGTQWTVFEPNTPDLWARIRRSVTAFLTNVWRSGALFGNTPEQAFYVKCDEENNPPEVRDAGQVIIEIGVAVVKPAEFVIFRLSQWAGPGSK
ncbi:phage tail sheath protein [Nostoc carneum NIES-2107]|nr:phage tail sheath protein [Nostoc carneum NIES-2107]